jgi:hypothetical protein
MTGILFQARTGMFSIFHNIQIGPESHPPSYPTGTSVFLGLKRLEVDTDHSPLRVPRTRGGQLSLSRRTRALNNQISYVLLTVVVVTVSTTATSTTNTTIRVRSVINSANWWMSEFRFPAEVLILGVFVLSGSHPCGAPIQPLRPSLLPVSLKCLKRISIFRLNLILENFTKNYLAILILFRSKNFNDNFT